ncbi:transferring glycosyl group transferase [Trifolium pratense]|uniref:Transferring glycosyl group transferase n=1 Tax=Trifolium pratense TaxID=57577 RepID=A0A2K3JL71_TRIPR|nr:transferring glycosyl group transferase [Trifolium pratense]
MATIFKLLCLTIFLGLIFQAYGQPCSLNNIVVKQSKTSGSVWKVTVSNNCICTQSQVRFNCKGFQTSKSVDPTIFSGDCLLIQGQPLHSSESVSFTYARDSQFTFQPISSEIACS